ncbi:hypothetical protein EZV62_000774 [Acer yangbiense]|uniref:Retrotransposon gag domain-containing protein n=1 Tax=Acer yangbiense TaxID=1000413 RepID=A0A5C7ISN0_9ROSI|nr:hypothetical protein EZV62_000774 [Acer yangbiense]
MGVDLITMTETRAQELKKMEEGIKQWVKSALVKNSKKTDESMAELKALLMNLQRPKPIAVNNGGSFMDSFHTMKVKIASIHLEGKALQWHQMYVKNRMTRDPPGWEEYVKALNIRFGVNVFEDPMADLMNLKQLGTLQDYMDKFDLALSRVSLTEEYTISCFISGLRVELQGLVRIFNPTNLQHAYSIARFIYMPCPHTSEILVEALMDCVLDWNVDRKISTITVDNCTTDNAMIRILVDKISGGSLLLGGNFFHMRYCAHILNLIVKERLDVIVGSVEKIRDSVVFWAASPKREEIFFEATRQLNIHSGKKLSLDCKTRSKGLCFWCDDKFFPGHKCQNKKLHMITIQEVVENEDNSVVEQAISEETDDCSFEAPHVSVFALCGKGSTHNFLVTKVAKAMGCILSPINPLLVEAACSDINYSAICRQFEWESLEIQQMPELKMAKLLHKLPAEIKETVQLYNITLETTNGGKVGEHQKQADHEKVQLSWKADPHIQHLIQKLEANPNSNYVYTWNNGIMLRKGRVVVGDDASLKL